MGGAAFHLIDTDDFHQKLENKSLLLCGFTFLDDVLALVDVGFA